MVEWDKTGFFRGFIEAKDKHPKKAYKDTEKYYEELAVLRRRKVDFNGLLQKNAVLLDADDEVNSNFLKGIIEGEQLHALVTQRDGGRGNHALFLNNNGYAKTKSTGIKLACGITVDVIIGLSNGNEALNYGGMERAAVYDNPPYCELPPYFRPIDGSIPAFHEMGDGDGRNSALFAYQLTLISNGLTIDEARETSRIINQYLFPVPLSDDELEVILRDEAYQKPNFFKGSTFMFDRFANFLMVQHHIIVLDQILHIWDKTEQRYISGYKTIESHMLRYLPQLTRAKRKEVLDYLELICPVKEPASSNLIAFRNGIYDLNSDELTPLSHEFIITNKINWNYNPSAYDELAENVLSRLACEDDEIINLLQEVIGACFYRSNKHLAGGKAFILKGEKSNGKSTFIYIINMLLGDDNVSALDLKKLEDRFSTARLHKKLANIGDDISDEFIPDPTFFKKIVTGDRITAEMKGMEPFEFNPFCKLIFSANRIPRIKDRTRAAMRRLIIVPFEAEFKEDSEDFDPFISKKLTEQPAMEHFIKVGMEGLKRVLQNNKFSKSEKAKVALQEYDLENDPVLSFIEECQDSEKVIINEPLDDVFGKYQGYCIRNNYMALAKNEFSKQIQNRLNLTTVRKRIHKYGLVRIFVEN